MTDNQQLELLKDILYDIVDNNTGINYDDIDDIKYFIKETMSMVYDDINIDLIDYNLLKILKCTFTINEEFNGKIIYKKNEVKIPKKYKKLVDHVHYIATLPQPEQRTKEWFDMRKNMITASCAAQAINENPYRNQNSDYLILDKLGMGEPFIDNKFVHHGKKYEEVATKIYENIYNIKVEEYGLIPHITEPRISYIGASPDGIASHYKLDNSFSDMVGRMLEIKCPFSRIIKTKGEIDGEICPHYYWCQVQQQLECCDLDYCDFWQCNLKEYRDREDWLDDTSPTKSTEEQEKDIFIPKNCQKGCIIQLLPKNKINEFCLFDAKYIYPPDINMSLYEYDKWIIDTITQFYGKYYPLMKNYVFDRVLYWKLENSHNVIIPRDKKWFKKVHPQFDSLWKKIVYLRDRPKEALKFKEELLSKIKTRKRSSKKSTLSKETLFVDSDSSDSNNKPTSKISIRKKKVTKKIVDDLFVDSE
jgi:putative phage-type endonuclease